MSAVKIAVTGQSQPTIVANSGQTNYLWAVAQRSGLLVFQPSISGVTLRLDPVTLQVIWSANTGPAHEIATDGSRVFVPVEGTPGTLIVLNSAGSQTASVPAPDGWANVYGIDYDAPTRRLYISSGADTARGVLGGLYIYDVSQTRPVYQGKISQPSSDLTVSGTRLWRQRGTTLEAWDVSNPQSPVAVGSWTSSVVTGPGGTPVQNVFGSMAVNSSGTRLYVTYKPVTAAQGNQVLDWPSGFMIFDVSTAIPRPLTQQSWAVNAPYYEQPLVVALSPNQATLAVSYWAFGVRFYGIAGDTVTSLGTVATTGEAHDVYVDDQGILYVFAHDDIQVLDPATGHHIRDIPIVGMVVDGGWRPFRDGNIIVPGPSATIMKLAGGGLQFSQGLPGFGNFTWSVVFDGTTYLYQGDETGRVHVDTVSLTPTGTYNVVEVGSVQISGLGSGGNPLLSMVLQGTNLWVIGPNVGVAAVDVSTPSAPRVIYRDPFTFETNGSHAGMVIAQNTVYAGAGAMGVRIYNPFTFTMRGTITGFNVNFLDTLANTYLVIANYWYAANPDGVYLFNIARNSDSPPLVSWFPQPHGNANFRARVVGNVIYRVPLYGVDALQGPPVALKFGHPGSSSYGINSLWATPAIDCPYDWWPCGFPGHRTVRPEVIDRRRADANDI
jgi:hypothetical protein